MAAAWCAKGAEPDHGILCDMLGVRFSLGTMGKQWEGDNTQTLYFDRSSCFHKMVNNDGVSHSGMNGDF